MTYEYDCVRCGRFEVTRSILDDPLTECPECKGEIYQIFSPHPVLWLGKFRWMKFNPDLDMDKIEIQQGKGDYRSALSKIKEGLKR